MADVQTASSPATAPRDLPLQEHYIGGRFCPSASGATFETLNPSTNEVLALAADGREEDVAAAVTAARRAFDDGPWPRMKAAARAAVLRRVAQAIRDHADEFIAREVADIGMPVAQMKGLAAQGGAELRLLRGRRAGAVRAGVPGRRRVPELHDPQAGGRGRSDHAVERAADAVDLADRAGAGGGQHRGAQAGGVVAADRDAPGRRDGGGRSAARGLQRGAGVRRDRRGAAVVASGRGPDLLHRRDDDRAGRSSRPARRR